MTTRVALLFSFLSMTAFLQAGTLEVGEGKQYSTIGAAAAAVQPGDTVLIYPGVYREAVRWRIGSLQGEPITVRGVEGSRPVIDGTGVGVSGSGQIPRALFQVEADNYVFENLELRNARNGQNAAGFRMLNSRRTVIRNVKVVWNDMGMMSVGNSDLLVEYSEIAYNGTPLYNGYSHNVYMEGDRTTFRHCYLHDSTNGQTFKTRGRYVELLYNYIADAHDRIDFGDATKEMGFQESVEATLPNSHAVLIGNVLVKRGQGVAFIDFGPEGSTPARNGTLFMINNTVIREGERTTWMLRMGHPDQKAVLYNNIFYATGPMEFSRGTGGQNVTGSNNWFPEGSTVPAGLQNNIFGAEPGFVDRTARDYRLRADSPLVDAGLAEPTHLDADGQLQPARLTSQYVGHKDRRDRPVSGAPDVGALELADEDRAPSELTISGRLIDQNGKPLEFFPVRLMGPDPRTVMTQAGGEYAFRAVRPGGPYSVAPWAGDFGFEPAQRDFPTLDIPQPADFTAPPLYTISGNIFSRGRRIPITQAIIFLSGSQSGWTATGTGDADFQFRNLVGGGSYTLQPLRSNVVFQEKTKTVEGLAEDTHVDLVGDQQFSVTGTVLDAAGNPIDGLTLQVTGDVTRTTVSNVRGNYSFAGLPEEGAYNVSVKADNLPFSPPVASFAPLAKSEVAHFRGPATFAIRGVMLRNNGEPIPEAIARRAQVRLTGLQTITGNADASGNFLIQNVLEGGAFRLTAFATGVIFPAVIADITDLRGEQTLEVRGKMADLTISGIILDKEGKPVRGVLVAIAGTQARNAVSDANGKYTITSVVEGGALTVTPTLKGFTFSPASVAVPNVAGPMVQNFTAATP